MVFVERNNVVILEDLYLKQFVKHTLQVKNV